MTTRLQDMLKVLRFAFHMTPKNTKNRLPTDLFSRQSLRSEGKELLDEALEVVWEGGRQAGLAEGSRARTTAPSAPVAKAVDSDLEAAARRLLDPAISTTKALILLQAERTRRGIQG